MWSLIIIATRVDGVAIREIAGFASEADAQAAQKKILQESESSHASVQVTAIRKGEKARGFVGQ